MLITFAVFLLLFSFCREVFAEHYCLEGYKRPNWADKFASQDLENTRIEVVRGIASSRDNAEQNALNKIISNKATSGGQAMFTVASNGDVVASDRTLRVKARVLAQCTEDMGADYEVSLLVQTAKKPDYDYDEVEVKSIYPFSGRVFVPGMAQIYKGQNVKGALFITGEILFIGGIAASFAMQSHYKKKAKDPQLDKNYYDNKASYAGYAGWAFVGAAAALYIANIIDGAVAYIDLDGGGPTEPHIHDHNHLFIVTEGEARILLGEREVVVHKDEAFLVDGTIPHSVWNNVNGVTKMIGITVK